MSTQLELRGSLSIGGPCASGNGCGASGSTCAVDVSLKCPTESYAAVVQGDVSIATTPFVDLELLEQLVAVQYLQVKSSSPVTLRIGAAAAVVTGVGGTFPTGFAGGETLDLSIDGTVVNVVFTAAASSASDVAVEINQAAVAAGLSFLPAAVVNGQIQITGTATGSDGSVSVTGGTGAGTLGLTGLSDTGDGADVPVDGMFLAQFGRDASAPQRVQVSGTASLEIVAAGTSS